MRVQLIFLSFALLIPLISFSQTVIVDQSTGAPEKPADFKPVIYGAASGFTPGYTDEEQDLVDNFYHEGKANRIQQEACQEDPDLCTGADVKRNNLAEMAAKMFGLVMQGTGGKIKTKDGEKNDYCQYIAMGTEAIALASQVVQNEAIVEVPLSKENAQKESLYQIKRSHESRIKVSEIQEKGWGATSICYVAQSAAYMTVDLKSLAAAGAAAWLAKYYHDIKKEQEKRVQLIQDLIDKLPNTGDCNPITERNCYCEEETSKAEPIYMKYCWPTAYQEYTDNIDNRISCLDDEMKEDPECLCIGTNTCYDMTYSKMVANFPNKAALTAEVLPTISSLSRGDISGADVTGVNTNLNAATKKLTQKDRDKVNSGKGVDPNKLNLLTSSGMDPALAKAILQSELSAKGLRASQKFKKGSSSPGSNPSLKDEKSAPKGDSQIMFFDGKGIQKKKARSNRNNDYQNQYKKKTSKKIPTGQLMRFNQRASNKAQINRNKNRSIFDIISRRYQVSKWRKMVDSPAN